MPDIKWLLNREQIWGSFTPDGTPRGLVEIGAQVELRHVAEMLFASCGQHGDYQYGPRHECPTCLRELKKAAGL